METKMKNNQTMEQAGQANKDSTKQTLDFITDKIKGKFVMLPQFISVMKNLMKQSNLTRTQTLV